MNKINKELKEFLEYKKQYNFVQKELVEKNNCIYCENELVQDEARK